MLFEIASKLFKLIINLFSFWEHLFDSFLIVLHIWFKCVEHALQNILLYLVLNMKGDIFRRLTRGNRKRSRGWAFYLEKFGIFQLWRHLRWYYFIILLELQHFLISFFSLQKVDIRRIQRRLKIKNSFFIIRMLFSNVMLLLDQMIYYNFCWTAIENVGYFWYLGIHIFLIKKWIISIFRICIWSGCSSKISF